MLRLLSSTTLPSVMRVMLYVDLVYYFEYLFRIFVRTYCDFTGNSAHEPTVVYTKAVFLPETAWERDDRSVAGYVPRTCRPRA